MNGWISVRKELPKVGEVVLGWSTLDENHVLCHLRDRVDYDHIDNWHCIPMFGGSYKTTDGISHWQPLPERPLEIVNNDAVISALLP